MSNDEGGARKPASTITRLATGGSDRSAPETPAIHVHGASRNEAGLAAELQPRSAADIVEIWQALQQADMLVPGSALGRETVDEYRRIKRPLISNAVGESSSLVDRGKLLMVTSSVPNEGKTYIATNLAISIAREQDTTGLLVDCDSHMKGVSRLVGIHERLGLMDILNKGGDISETLVRTDIPGLAMIPSGREYENATELIASRKMSLLLDELLDRYHDRIIILDTPPLLATPQAQVMLQMAGQVVFIVEAGKTPQGAIQEALGMVPEGKPIGVVLNKTNTPQGVGGYYGGYYGSSGGDD